MLFIHRQYRPRPRSLPSATTSSSRGRGAKSASSSPCRASTGRSSRPSMSGARSRRTSAAVLISDDPAEAARIRERWERQLPDVPLVVVESPYRALVGPLLAYLDVLDRAGRRTRRRRSRSSSSPSTSRAAGGSGSSTTSRPIGCGRPCWAAPHGRRQRPLPPRGTRPRAAAGVTGGLTGRDRSPPATLRGLACQRVLMSSGEPHDRQAHPLEPSHDDQPIQRRGRPARALRPLRPGPPGRRGHPHRSPARAAADGPGRGRRVPCRLRSGRHLVGDGVGCRSDRRGSIRTPPRPAPP